MKIFNFKAAAVAFSVLVLAQQASAFCACYGRKYYRDPVSQRLTYRDDFIGNTSREDCNILATRLGYDAFYLYCGY